MKPGSDLTRLQFLRVAAGGALGSLAVLAAACGGDDGDSPPIDAAPADGSGPDGAATVDAPPSACSPSATIGTNHGHTLTVPAADVTAAQPRTYDITGSSPHAHSVSLTAAHFAMLAQGMTVTVNSSSGAAHIHAVTIRC